MVTFLAFLLVLGVLVTFHEWGHYLAARACGVRVERFSIGFGGALFSHTDKNGTVWQLAPIPLGGYVKMLDKYDASMPEAWRTQSFQAQSVQKRMFIVAAGPVANILLAILLYTLVSLLGIQVLKSSIGTVLPNSPADEIGLSSGETITKIGNDEVSHWREVAQTFMEAQARGKDFVIETAQGSHTIHIANLPQDTNTPELFGIMPQKLLPQIAELEQGGAAQIAGLQVGDKITAINGQRIVAWHDLHRVLQDLQQPDQKLSAGKPKTQISGGQNLQVEVQRNGKTLIFSLTAPVETLGGIKRARLGFFPSSDEAWLASLQFTQRTTLFSALIFGIERSFRDMKSSLTMIGAMIAGRVGTENLGGPVAIANLAGQTAKRGLVNYLEFLALLSISLAVLNLLPVPVLDGGHLLYHAAEWLRGKPLPERVQALGQMFGLLMILGLMGFALFNDINRFFAG